jgi:hypothetical protein
MYMISCKCDIDKYDIDIVYDIVNDIVYDIVHATQIFY